MEKNWGTMRLSVWLHVPRQVNSRYKNQTLVICPLTTRFLVVFCPIIPELYRISARNKQTKNTGWSENPCQSLITVSISHVDAFLVPPKLQISLQAMQLTQLKNWKVTSWPCLGPQSINCYQWRPWEWRNDHKYFP